MNKKSELTLNAKSVLGDIISWFFGLIFIAIGLVNMFWGNDPGYGIFIFLLSLLYFPPVTVVIKRITNISTPLLVSAKILLGIFILWSALGVGELFDKVELMMAHLNL